ncbi:oxygen-independent coproporphyrinogen-3 oxidase [Rubricella aquisinus]|uniref:Coproporphyrinogen-III oxidase n=1 Tax=Rubricella aquisinus TaxID=2028108 RepID=A0A840X0C9_9RHOB|nr:oxygen-independent coproporphyrinogen III oxidase [Rubricella aquisinus]MBB5514117.1 oxygen-independent coproporphyrinogen-3 oxidase [Rubricella aquisinus]
MTQKHAFAQAGLFDRSVPRYTSYPAANHFGAVSEDTYRGWLADLPAGPISLYVHIPFCERLCYFCACRTQGVNSAGPVIAYLETLEQEIAMLAQALPDGVTVGRMHWGGGTPTILTPAQIAALSGMLRAALPFEPDGEFSVEIDPACVDDAKLDALIAAGLNRGSVGVQDFALPVQETIGRLQSVEETTHAMRYLREHGVTSMNADLVYGLPRQTMDSLGATLDQIIDLGPERIALYGYAHVPWMSKRQRVIPEDTLPDPQTRLAMAELSADRLTAAGYVPIGIDHFAKPGDGLARAAAGGTLRRNFQGYTDDTMGALIGLGASSISRLPGGYGQNAPATPAWAERVKAGQLPVMRGLALSADDRLRARAIECLMCDFRLDFAALSAEMRMPVTALMAEAAEVAQRWPFAVTFTDGVLTIAPEARVMTRLIAETFDAYADATKTANSRAI